jgi:hypothetical protein
MYAAGRFQCAQQAGFQCAQQAGLAEPCCTSRPLRVVHAAPRYRSAGQYLCLTAPLVEQIPSDFMPCDMAPDGVPAAAVHLFYDTIPDGYIDRNEFAAGRLRDVAQLCSLRAWADLPDTCCAPHHCSWFAAWILLSNLTRGTSTSSALMLPAGGHIRGTLQHCVHVP